MIRGGRMSWGGRTLLDWHSTQTSFSTLAESVCQSCVVELERGRVPLVDRDLVRLQRPFGFLRLLVLLSQGTFRTLFRRGRDLPSCPLPLLPGNQHVRKLVLRFLGVQMVGGQWYLLETDSYRHISRRQGRILLAQRSPPQTPHPSSPE